MYIIIIIIIICYVLFICKYHINIYAMSQQKCDVSDDVTIVLYVYRSQNSANQKRESALNRGMI